MGTPSAELRSFFGQCISDESSEEFLSWLADVDALVREIAPHMDLLDVTNPGWDQLWLQDASPRAAIDACRAIDFVFEGHFDLWREAQR